MSDIEACRTANLFESIERHQDAASPQNVNDFFGRRRPVDSRSEEREPKQSSYQRDYRIIVRKGW